MDDHAAAQFRIDCLSHAISSRVVGDTVANIIERAAAFAGFVLAEQTTVEPAPDVGDEPDYAKDPTLKVQG